MMTPAQSQRLTRPAIIAAARTWIGTPYHHQASTRQVGCDCLGFVRGLYRDLYGHEPEPPPAYTRDWAEASGRETLIDAAQRHLRAIPLDAASAGDLLIFRWRRTTPAKHIGLMSSPTHMIHAQEGASVQEVLLAPWWQRHRAAAFALPSLNQTE